MNKKDAEDKKTDEDIELKKMFEELCKIKSERSPEEDSLIKIIGKFVPIIYARVIREDADGVVEIYDCIKHEYIKTHLSKQELIDNFPSRWISKEAVRLIIEIFVYCCKTHRYNGDRKTIILVHKLVLKSITEVITTGKFVTYIGETIDVTPEIRKAFKDAFEEAYETINPPAKENL